jgi:hypothetical protein
MTSALKRRQLSQSFTLFAVSLFCMFGATVAHAQWKAMNPVREVRQETDGVVFTMGKGNLRVQVCSD